MKYLTKKNTKSKENLTKLVLIDIDKTLVNVFEFHENAFQKTFKEKTGINAKMSDVDFEGKRYEDIFKEVGELKKITFTEKEIKELLEFQEKNFIKILPKKVKLLLGAENLLKTLNKKYVLGIVTGNSKKIGEEILKHANVYKYFKLFSYSEDAPTRAEMVKKVIKRAGKDIKKVIIIGDSVEDIKSAKANNAESIAVTTGTHSESKLLKHQPTLLVKNLEDKKVLELIQNE